MSIMIFNHFPFSFLHQSSTCNFGKERKWKEETKGKKGKTSLSSICSAFKNEDQLC